MPKHNILERIQTNQRVPRNGFDLSYRRLFTADAGELLPIYCEHVNPNEHFRINPQVFLRTATLNTAAYTRIKQNVEFFFIPYRLLLTQLPQAIVGTNWNNSTQFYKVLRNAHVPCFKVGNFLGNPSVDGYYPVNCLSEINPFNPLCDYNDSSTSAATGQAAHSAKDMFGFNMTDKSSKLAQLLGYGSTIHGTASSDNAMFSVSTLNFQAYQKVYNDFYRNPLLEPELTDYFNLDRFYQARTVDAGVEDGKILGPSHAHDVGTKDDDLGLFRELVTLRYRNWKKDLYTHLRPDFAGADFLTLGLSSPILSQSYSADTSFTGRPVSGVEQSGVNGAVGGFSISNLRSAYALDKLLFVTQNAKDGSYNEQIKAHFGFDPHLDNQKVQFIGSVDAPVTISDVEATSTTDNSTLGQIAGKGVSLTNGGFEFDTREHGIIMGVFSIVPEVDYPDYGVDPMLTKVYGSDFYKPEFGDLGYQPMTFSGLSASTINSGHSSQETILGYTNRYAEYKSRIDKVDGEFLGDLNAWVTTRNLSDYANQLKSGISNVFQKINPSYLNNIFALRADGKHAQFLCNAFFNVQAIRPMSVYGVPYSNI